MYTEIAKAVYSQCLHPYITKAKLATAVFFNYKNFRNV